MLPLLTACGERSPEAAFAVPGRLQDAAVVAQGGRLYRQHCAECHGSEGEGAANWRQRDAEGMFPPPPLNGTGHAWHHPSQLLYEVIANGSPAGQGRMPAWRGRLREEEIAALIAWFQSRWPDEVYAAWYQMEQRRHGGS